MLRSVLCSVARESARSQAVVQSIFVKGEDRLLCFLVEVTWLVSADACLSCIHMHNTSQPHLSFPCLNRRLDLVIHRAGWEQAELAGPGSGHLGPISYLPEL